MTRHLVMRHAAWRLGVQRAVSELRPPRHRRRHRTEQGPAARLAKHCAAPGLLAALACATTVVVSRPLAVALATTALLAPWALALVAWRSDDPAWDLDEAKRRSVATRARAGALRNFSARDVQLCLDRARVAARPLPRADSRVARRDADALAERYDELLAASALAGLLVLGRDDEAQPLDRDTEDQLYKLTNDTCQRLDELALSCDERSPTRLRAAARREELSVRRLEATRRIDDHLTT